MGKINMANLKKTAYYLRRNGLKNTLDAVRERLDRGAQPDYRYEPVTDRQLAAQREQARREAYTVSFSIVVPTYRTPEKYLREMIDSVRGQSYENWELIIADATEGQEVREAVEEACGRDDRVLYVRLDRNGGISENTNAGILRAKNEYIGLLDHDDMLEKNALFEMAARIEEAGKAGVELKLLYSDEDKCDGGGSRYYEPNLKEDFNLDLLLTNNYICHFMVIETKLMQKLLMRREYEGAQDFDLVLRAVGALAGREECIAHVPRVLYHWRCHMSSTAENPRSKLYAYEAGKRAVQDFLNGRGWSATVLDTAHLGFYSVHYEESPLKIRRDLGAVGGRLVRGGKVVGGRLSAEGKTYYEGLRANYSGYMHRASLAQEAEALDIRNIEVAECCRESFEHLVGAPYATLEGTDIFDASVLPAEADITALSVRVGRELRRQGYKLLYFPERTVEL